MSQYTIKPLNRHNISHYKSWKNILSKLNGSTIFHDPDFLGYHGDKFNEHHLGVYKGESLIGMIPLAINEEKNSLVAKSPYGASYGGFIFKSIMSYSHAKSLVEIFIEYLKNIGVSQILITPSCHFYHKPYSDTFTFALLEQGFKIINSDITSVVLLENSDLENNIFTSRARNMQRKAIKENVNFRINCPIDDFWPLMEKTFQRHGVSPTHSKAELITLNKKFPNEIYFNIAYIEDKPIAGMCVFKINNLVNMSFYLYNK